VLVSNETKTYYKFKQRGVYMEITMSSSSKKSNSKIPSITELIQNTPSLERYVIANIITKFGKPRGYEGKYKFIIYKGWIKGETQYGRVNFYHKRFCKKTQTEVVTITSYFIHISIRDIGICIPENNSVKPDLFIVYPTKG
jgi:hypothetical protein|tara:strand:- start:1033 stop:1455 length:423 start_codon:yes stop_codon:yes gene_type:complete